MSKSIWALTVMFSRVVLHIMGVVNVIDCFPILATNTVEIVSDSDVGTDRLPKNCYDFILYTCDFIFTFTNLLNNMPRTHVHLFLLSSMHNAHVTC